MFSQFARGQPMLNREKQIILYLERLKG